MLLSSSRHEFEVIEEIPRPLQWAAERNTYSRGGADFSVTELIGPARISALRWRLAQSGIELPQREATDFLFAMIGTALHRSLEIAARKAEEEGEEILVEKRVHTIRYVDGQAYRISGQEDYVEMTPSGAILTDYKTTSVWAAIFGPKPEHIRQLEIYSLLLAESGFPVREARLCLILRDWSYSKVGRERDYPESPVVTFRIPLRPIDEVEAYLMERLEAHVRAREGLLPECTEEERWVRDAKIAVYKGSNRKRALKLFDPDDPTRADQFVAAQSAKHPGVEFVIEHRPGTNTRCERYCEVSEHCSWYHALRADAAQLPEPAAKPNEGKGDKNVANPF